jgi:putative molybdopterin biosynthesis protein
LRELGQVIVHGVAIKPGKPVILALVEGTPVIGLPGYPLATYFNFNTFVKPVLALFNGLPRFTHPVIRAILAKRLVSSLKFREYVQAKVGMVGDRLIAAPLSRGSGVISSLVRSDGYLVIPQEREGIEAGEQVEVHLYRDLSKVTRTCMAVGSHDLVMDIIADLMPRLHGQSYLSSTHVGSQAGLNALHRGEAHLAPCHLLDARTGTYNEVAVQSLAFPEPMALIKGFQRIQGMMLAPGNPLLISTLRDLLNKPASFINRQRGSGTRVLFDHLLKQQGIAPEQIYGYAREATTHMAVATAVASGSADAGLGVLSAARALQLEFVPVGAEQYDFAIPQRFLELEQVRAFIATLQSPELRTQLEQLGGYGFEQTGEVVLLEPVDTSRPFSMCRY